MSTTDDILQAAIDQAASGVKQVQTGDKIIIYMTPKEQLEAKQLAAADALETGPFIRVGFAKRSY